MCAAFASVEAAASFLIVKMSHRTRHSSGTALKDYIGTSRGMLTSELPILRAAFRNALLLQEESFSPNKRQAPVKDFLDITAADVIALYKKANHMFEYPVIHSQKALKERLIKDWEKAQNVARGKASQKVKDEMSEKLDRLLDILR
jgi:hypothetical protein